MSNALLTQADIGSTVCAQNDSRLAFDIATAIAPTHWWRADNVVTSGGLVDTIVDNGSGAKNFTQSGAARCAVATDSDGKVYLAPDGSADYYQAGVASDWRFLHNGDPYLVWAVVHFPDVAASAYRAILSTANATSDTGFMLQYTYSGTSTWRGPDWYMCRGALGAPLMRAWSLLPPVNQKKLIMMWNPGYGNSTAPTSPSGGMSSQTTLYQYGHPVAHGAWSASAPSTGDPTSTLTLFRAGPSATAFSNSRLYDLGIVRKRVPLFLVNRLAEKLYSEHVVPYT